MKSRKATLAFIFVVVLIDMLALGIITPVLPRLVERLSAGKPRAPPRCSGSSVRRGP